LKKGGGGVSEKATLRNSRRILIGIKNMKQHEIENRKSYQRRLKKWQKDFWNNRNPSRKNSKNKSVLYAMRG
jgi:hypothetical protein